jgi:hypothetical protein
LAYEASEQLLRRRTYYSKPLQEVKMLAYSEEKTGTREA